MNQRKTSKRLSRLYTSALRRYCQAFEKEAGLEEAYEIGRAAIAAGFGVLDMARVHLEAREYILQADGKLKNRARLSKLAGAFFLQSLSPFEATHRGFRETNAELLKRNQELAAEIAERKRTEQALRESERRYSTLVKTAHDVIFSLTPDGRIAAVNPAFEKITGWPASDWLGKPFVGLVHPDEAAVAIERFKSILSGKPPEMWQYRVRKADGNYSFGEFTLAREMKHRQPVGVFGIGRDITARKQAEEALKSLPSKVFRAQEEERKHISRELHDEVGQSLTAISVTLAALQKKANGQAYHFSRTIAGSQRLLEGTMEAVHRFARELRPAMLDELGLLPALRSHIKVFSERASIPVVLKANPAVEDLNAEQKTAIFRIVQECLTNVAKHAHATRVKISIRQTAGEMRLDVADNGKSFRVNAQTAARQQQRLGLIGMQERVRLLNGSFNLKPEVGRGTTVSVAIPLHPPVTSD